MKTVHLILPLYAVLLYSCSHLDSQVEKVRRITNANGDVCILPYIIIGTDTLTNGKAVCYARNGKLKEEIEYAKGLKEGWDKHYDSSGTLESRISFANGKKNGYGIFYDVKGEIRKIYFIQDQAVAEERMNNRLIPIQYRIFRENGDVQYVVLFDSSGKKFYEKGFVFEDSVRFGKLRKDSLLVNEPVEMRIFTTQLPGYSRLVRVDFFDQSNKKTNVAAQVSNDDFYTTIRFTPRNLGKKTIGIIGELKDNTGKIVKTDTLIQAVTVY